MRALGHVAPLGVLIAALLAAAGVRADAVPPPPASCPPGSVPSTSHAGPHCRPAAECMLSATCAAGQACETIGLCIEEVPCGGRPLPIEAGVCTEPHVLGTCSATSACGAGRCELHDVCVPPSSARSGCACRAGRGGAVAGLAGLGLVLAALAARRR